MTTAHNATRIALFGFGTVGRATFAILEREQQLNVHMIVVRNKQKYLPNQNDEDVKALFVDDMTLALQRIKDVDVVIEVMGGTTDAWIVVQSAILKGKVVVTANKALMSTYMHELNEMPTGKLYFEAAVAGGIPIVRSLLRDVQCFRAKGFGCDKVQGILNGTSNFILTKMSQDGVSYTQALEEAQQLGYAEVDPSADVLGWDARAKIHLLQRLCFGTTVPPNKIVCEGITRIEPVDFEYARRLDCKIKLVATTEVYEEAVRTYVFPTMVPAASSLGATDGVLNIVTMTHATMGTYAMQGEGAGGKTTAHSVCADVLQALHGPKRSTCFGTTAGYSTQRDFYAGFCLRLTATDEVGIIRDIGNLAANANLQIEAILQNPHTGPTVQFVVVLHPTWYQSALAFADKINVMCQWSTIRPFLTVIMK